MKPPPFDYFDPATLEDALSLLNDLDRGAKILAGGQSLLPMLKIRMAKPGALIDINRLDELRVMADDDEGLKVGAIVRQLALAKHEGLAEINPLLAEALPLIGHVQTRSRGTICGSLAHADPSAELPAVAVTQGARFTLQSRRGERVVSAQNFFRKPHTTIMDRDEMLTHVTFPRWQHGDGWAIEEVGRRPGDFALAGVAVLLSPANGVCVRARITSFGLADVPRRASAAEALLEGKPLTPSLVDSVVTRVQAEMKTQSDIHASADYRRQLIGALTRRTLLRAAKRAGLYFNG
ncbi:MAG TPA: xanthine dehydrogenase family protein subunit M [Pyrinomonadaceae bacterium]|nr:xanthine dehydrogenase family protein subunit M [Pyrinomonadaceae bacterium]